MTTAADPHVVVSRSQRIRRHYALSIGEYAIIGWIFLWCCASSWFSMATLAAYQFGEELRMVRSARADDAAAAGTQGNQASPIAAGSTTSPTAQASPTQ